MGWTIHQGPIGPLSWVFSPHYLHKKNHPGFKSNLLFVFSNFVSIISPHHVSKEVWWQPISATPTLCSIWWRKVLFWTRWVQIWLRPCTLLPRQAIAEGLPFHLVYFLLNDFAKQNRNPFALHWSTLRKKAHFQENVFNCHMGGNGSQGAKIGNS